MPVKKRKFAVVGCGKIGRSHIAAINSLSEEASLIAVVDQNEELCNQLKQELGVSTFTSIEKMIDAKLDLDIVSLATPSGLHANQVNLIANAGLNVVTEKPMATRWNDGKEMVQICDKNKVQLFVVKQLRHYPNVKALKEIIENKGLGRIYNILCNVVLCRPQEYYESASWRGTWEFDGGVLMNQSSHYVDLLEWLFGPIESVQAICATLAREIEVEDTASVNFKWRNGAIGSFNTTVLNKYGNFETSLTVIAEKGSVKLGGKFFNEILNWQFNKEETDSEEIKKAAYFNPKDPPYRGHKMYFQSITDHLNGKEVSPSDGRDGLKCLELLTAAYLSARDGKRICLPLEH